MKKLLSPLFALLICLTVQHADAQQEHAVIQIPIGALQAAYRASFGNNPDFSNYTQLALAINRCKAQYFPNASGGFWNGVITENNADHSQDSYSIVTIGQGSFPRNPQAAPKRFLKDVFQAAIGRPADLDSYPDLAVALDRYNQQYIHCSGGFWNGEHAMLNGADTRGIVWVQSPNEPQNIPVSELVASFQSRMQRSPNFSVWGDMALAVTGWIQDHEPGKALGGFWDGEQTNPPPNTVYGVVLVR